MDVGAGGRFGTRHEFGDVSVRTVEDMAEHHRHPLAWWQRPDRHPERVVGLERRAIGGGDLGQVLAWDRAARRSTVMVDRLSGGDRQDPAVELGAVRDPPVGPERRQERLLEDVIGVLGTHRDHQEAVHRRPIRVQERLERRDRTPCSRPMRAHRHPPATDLVSPSACEQRVGDVRCETRTLEHRRIHGPRLARV
jgi:hypothetical protein